jgi:pentapeptide repeat protein
MRAMVRRDAADPPYAPDVPAEAEPLEGLDAATLREERGSSIIGARLARADFGGAKLPSLRLVDVRLEQCNLANVDARGATLVRCELRGLHGVERLRGVGVTWGDLLELAPALAGALGIRLLDADDDAGAGAS